ncbi:Unknown protein [Striga hermonthica]|uniref:Uncharacterized protein n=1 Tax=Striga hermonthica TaxID=68872 RepID=A0A9N7NLP1_STRHE|nr:Unknown protein [Striga hermonthica]
MVMKKMEAKIEYAPKVFDCGSPLYDSHELVSLANVIERHTMALPWSSGPGSGSELGSSRGGSGATKKKNSGRNIFRRRREKEKSKGVKSVIYGVLSKFGLINKM